VTQVANGVNATIRIGLGPYVVEVAGRRAIARYMKERPRARVEIMVAAYDAFVPLLRREHLDFYIADVADAVFRDDVHLEDIAVPPLRWACRVGHPLLAQMPADAKALTQYPIASTTPPVRFRKWLMDLKRIGTGAGQAAPDDPLSVMCDNGTILRELGMTTDCIGYASEPLIFEEVAAGRLALLETTVDPPRNRIAIVRRTAPELSAPAARLIEIFREEFARM